MREGETDGRTLPNTNVSLLHLAMQWVMRNGPTCRCGPLCNPIFSLNNILFRTGSSSIVDNDRWLIDEIYQLHSSSYSHNDQLFSTCLLLYHLIIKVTFWPEGYTHFINFVNMTRHRFFLSMNIKNRTSTRFSVPWNVFIFLRQLLVSQ